MGTKVIAQVEDLIEGDETVMAVIDVNIIDDTLQGLLDRDYQLTLTVPRASGGSIYTPPMLYRQILDLVALQVSTDSGTLVTRYEVFVPGWNAYRDQGTLMPYVVDDFMSATSTSGQIGELGWSSSLGGSAYLVSSGDSSADGPGQVEIGTGTTTGQSPFMHYTPGFVWDDMGEAIFMFQTPANSVSSLAFEVGFYTGSTWRFCLYFSTLMHASKIYWRARDASGNDNFTDSGLTVALEQRCKVTISRIDNAHTKFTLEENVNGQSVSTIVTHSAVPTGVNGTLYPFFLINNKSTVNKVLYVDWFSAKLNVSRA